MSALEANRGYNSIIVCGRILLKTETCRVKQTWCNDGNVEREGERVGEKSGKKARELRTILTRPFVILLCRKMFFNLFKFRLA